MSPKWFRRRGYRHFDVPVTEAFASGKASSPDFVRQHSWLPLIAYVKRTKRYKPIVGKTTFKDRLIMYPSHRDSCILSRYAYELNARLDDYYQKFDLSKHVIAYRKLGKANYDFAADAFRYCLGNGPCVVLCFDITGFFDNLDHSLLKDRLKQILDVDQLAEDWYKVFRFAARYRAVARCDLAGHPAFGRRLRFGGSDPIATISEIKAAGVQISCNENFYGIPQGTPISSALSNAYMILVDRNMATLCCSRSALYQRYSDDILIACKPGDEADLTAELISIIENHKLKLKKEKTERISFSSGSTRSFQYLGFNLSPQGVCIRPSSLSRQWRVLRRSIRKAERVGKAAIETGKANQIFTKKLRRKLSPVGVRNFSSYARRSAVTLNSKAILRQINRLESAADHAIRDLKR